MNNTRETIITQPDSFGRQWIYVTEAEVRSHKKGHFGIRIENLVYVFKIMWINCFRQLLLPAAFSLWCSCIYDGSWVGCAP